MKTKVMAARTATAGGCALAITRGDVEHPLAALAGGARATWFAAQGTPQQKRKAWIAAMKPRGRVTVDAGAARALARGQQPAARRGERGCGGVRARRPGGTRRRAGRVLGQGLTRYDSSDAARILGLRSIRSRRRSDHPPRGPLIHRDDMAI